jgi:hypothetical protein
LSPVKLDSGETEAPQGAEIKRGEEEPFGVKGREVVDHNDARQRRTQMQLRQACAQLFLVVDVSNKKP